MCERNRRAANADEADEASGGGFVAGFFVGALVGAVGAMMVAPRAGTEAPSPAEEQAGSLALGGRIREFAAVVLDQVTGIVADVRANLSEVYAGGKKTVDDARSAVGDAVSEARAAAEVQRASLERNEE